jgi:transcriptional activator, rgg/gadR/mutR family, C-terminal domain
MNIYFSEFEELFQGENSQKEFLNEVIKAKKENDAYLWEVLKKREEEAFEKSKNIRHLHNKILMEAFLAEMDGQTLSKISKRQILNYLFDIENWGLYEIELFGNFTIFFSPEENHQFVHLLRKKKNHFSSERRYIEIASKLLLNILLKDILLGSKYGDDILKEIEQLLKREGFYAEKMSAQFFKGILMIQRNQKKDGEKLCNKSIQFFYDFEENHKGKLYRQFLSEQLNHK